MKYRFVGKNVAITDGIKSYTEKRFAPLTRFATISEMDVASIMIRTYPVGQKIEVTIPTSTITLRAEATNEDLYSAIDKVVDKLKDQLRRQKTKQKRQKKKSLKESAVDAVPAEKENYSNSFEQDLLEACNEVIPDKEFEDVDILIKVNNPLLS